MTFTRTEEPSWVHPAVPRKSLAPIFLIALLASNLLLVQRPFYATTAVLQLGFYALAAVGWLLKSHRAGRAKFLSIPFFYCLANAAALVAMMRLVRGERTETWQPQRRVAEA